MDNVKVKFSTLVEIRDHQTGELLVSDCNAVHPANLAFVIARGLANESNHDIFRVGLGNGGSYIDSVGTIRFNDPNTVGLDAKLYNETYFETVDQSGNSISSMRSPSGDTTSIVTVDLVIASNEPSSSAGWDAQWTSDAQGEDTAQNPQDPLTGYKYEFDELGCFSVNPFYDGTPVNGPEYLLLTHIVFHPIAKSQNRQLHLTYTLTVSVS